jgi:hypothetical protein
MLARACARLASRGPTFTPLLSTLPNTITTATTFPSMNVHKGSVLRQFSSSADEDVIPPALPDPDPSKGETFVPSDEVIKVSFRP